MSKKNGFGKIDSNPRKEKAKTQKLYLILAHPHDDKLIRKYDIMGSTSNVYTVNISNVPTCTCPDFTVRHNKKCKHIWFVLIRILQATTQLQEIDQYNDVQLKKMFINIASKVEAQFQAGDAVVNKYNKYKQLKINGDGKVTPTKIDDEDNCPVCLCNLLDDEETLIYCQYYCGHSVHKDCFEVYSKKQASKKCLYCLHDWEKSVDSQYINLA